MYRSFISRKESLKGPAPRTRKTYFDCNKREVNRKKIRILKKTIILNKNNHNYLL